MPHPNMFVHSCYTENDQMDAVVVKEMTYDDNGNIIRRLNIIKEPKRSFYLTKPQFRTHEFKKEFAELSELKQYIVHNKRLEQALTKALYGYVPNKPTPLRILCNSPYVYGADIPIETLIKMKYAELYGETDPIPYSIGFLDIECSIMTDNEDIQLITVTHDNHIYTAINENYLYHNIDHKKPHTPRIKATIEDVMKVCNTNLEPYIKKLDLKFHYFVSPNEIELLKWIWSNIHQNQTDFVGVWNMDFDIPKILRTIDKHRVDPRDILCSPLVPANLRRISYHEDRRPSVEHERDRWHWLHCTSATQITDSMNLYARLRKVKGYKDNYRLNTILQEELNLTKLSLGEEESHFIMQNYRFLDYIAYNQFDCIGLMLLEQQNNDHETMGILAGINTFDNFCYQTKMLGNQFYQYCMKHNRIPCSVGANMKTEFTKLVPRPMGGTVLTPESGVGVGANALKELPDYETMLTPHMADSDFAGYYPRTGMAMNVSVETKVCTTIKVGDNDNREYINDLYSNLISVEENAVYIGNHYLNLPNYKELDDIFSKL